MGERGEQGELQEEQGKLSLREAVDVAEGEQHWEEWEYFLKVKLVQLVKAE